MSKFENLLWGGLVIVLLGGCSKTDPLPGVTAKSVPVVASVESDNSDASPVELDASESEPEFDLNAVRAAQREKFKTTGELELPLRMEADGEPIDIGIQQSDKADGAAAHAGPTIADVDGDGDCDLLVGDFPGHFWFFENEKDDANPIYVAKGKLQADGVAAKTPVY